jgi:hypothetical protein
VHSIMLGRFLGLESWCSSGNNLMGVHVAMQNTKYIDLNDLLENENESALIIQLMMVVNDLSAAQSSFLYWKEDKPKLWSEMQRGAILYFIRLEMSHLFEGMKIIENIERNEKIKRAIERCDEIVQTSYAYLLDFLPRKSRRGEFENLVGRVRHNLTFHYYQNGDLITRALNDRASRKEAQFSKISRSDEHFGWRFSLGDEVIDSVLVRQIWDIPRDLDVRQEADKKADEILEIVKHFLDFASGFIWQYLSK